MAVVRNPTYGLNLWSCVFAIRTRSMREADANETSGELGSAFLWSLVGESVFSTAKLEILTESASWEPLVSVVPECHSGW